MDTLQTQWSWILQITKCIDVHLKENAAYFQVSSDMENSHYFKKNMNPIKDRFIVHSTLLLCYKLCQRWDFSLKESINF